MKNSRLAIYFILLVLLNFQTRAATKVTCGSVHLETGQLAKVRISLPTLLKKIDATAAELRGTEELTSPRVWRSRTAAYGLPGLDLPSELGGQGYKASQAVQVFQYVGRYALDLRDVVGGAHVRPLLQSGNSSQLEIVKKVARGEAYMAIAITEKDAGSNMRAMKSFSEKVDHGYLLTGEKMYNARLLNATHVVIFTRSTASGAGPSKLNAFVLPLDYPGLVVTNLNAKGLRGNSFGGVAFDHLFVPDEFRIGGEGEGGKVFRNHFLYWRLMMAAAAIGTGQGALDQAVQRMRTREAFGGPIGRFTHLQQALAEHTAKLHMASLLVQEAAKKIDQNKYDEVVALAAMAKAEGVEWALKAADFSMEVFAAEGYTDHVDLAQRVADLQGLRIADGTTHVLRQEVIRQMYGDDFWEMAIGSP